MTLAANGRGALAQAVADAALATPGVAGLDGGPGIPVGTYHPGGVVVGVSLTGPAVSVHVRADRVPLGPVTAAVAGAVGAVLATAGDPRPVRVVVEDVDDAVLARAVTRIGGR